MLQKENRASSIQIWVSVILVIACALLNFAPFITIETNFDEATKEEIKTDFYQEWGSEIEIPEKISISPVQLYKNIAFVVKTLQFGTQMDKVQLDTLSEEELATLEQEYQKTTEKVIDFLTSKDGILLVMLRYTPSWESFLEGDNAVASFWTSDFAPFSLLVCLVLLYCMLLFPIFYVLTALFALLSLLILRKHPKKAARKVSLKLLNKLGLLLLFVLCQFIIPNTKLAIGFWGILVLTFLNLIVNMVTTRSYPYSKEERAYITIIQFGALVAIIGTLVSFFNFFKFNVFTAFLLSQIFFIAQVLGFDGAPLSFVFVLICLTLGFVMGYIVYCTHRMSLATTLRERGHRIGYAVFSLVISIIAFNICNINQLCESFGVTPDEWFSSIVVFENIKGSLIVAIVGFAVALLAEIMIAILSKSMCKNLSRRDKEDLLNGIRRIEN